MIILNDVPLSAYSTMRLGGKAAFLAEANTREDLVDAATWAKRRNLPLMVIGEGSNIVWTDGGFSGLVIVNKILGFEIFEEDHENIYLTVGAGETWDDVVERSVNEGWSGIEQLSLIPGKAGATPIQNVGAYGREIADVLTSIEAYDTVESKFVNIPASECDFGYRTSRFKTRDKDRFLISSVTYHLTRMPPPPPYYPSLQKYLEDNTIKEVTPAIIRNGVISIRTSKLPDPKLVANCGSFFANPIIDRDEATNLRLNFPDCVIWELDSGRSKVSAAWLIEHAGFKDYHDKDTGMGTWPKQPLVLINESAQSTAQLINFRDQSIAAVKEKFDIKLEQEPEILPAS